FKIDYGTAVTGTTPTGRVFYGYNDTEILKYDDETDNFENLPDSSNILELTTRKYKGKYVTIPLFLKFQTNKIGQFIYYGKFGLRTSFLAGVRMDDEGFDAALDANGNYVR